MKNAFVASLVLAGTAHAYPWAASMEGVDTSIFDRAEKRQPPLGSVARCPVNKNHKGRATPNPKYPYCGAVDLVPAIFPCKNNLVPAPGDTAHEFVAPGPDDIRGPCPGLNTAANHNFLSHDGITTFTELVDMQQNVYGVGYDLAVVLATLGVALAGDPVTERVSIGCDATPRTSFEPGAKSGEIGLDGHNKFEADTSMTRNDYFLGKPAGNNFRYNATLFKELSDTCGGKCSLETMSKVRHARYQYSLNHNGNFFFGPKGIVLFGASSFLYELFPSRGDKGPADQSMLDYFFKLEQIPPAWYSRSTPYSVRRVAENIVAQYLKYPVAFGGNTGAPNTFVGIGASGPYISDKSMFNGTVEGMECFLYQLATENQPTSLHQKSDLPTSTLEWAARKLNPVYKTKFCPLNFLG